MKRIALLLLFVGLGTYVFAQDDLKPVKYENSTWHEVVLVKFKSGKIGEAKKIIAKYEEAGKTAGTPAPETYWFVTGSYDMLLVWDLEGGPGDLEWKWNPDGVKWWKAFVEQEGKEEAEKLSEKYSSLVAASSSQIVRKDK